MFHLYISVAHNIYKQNFPYALQVVVMTTAEFLRKTFQGKHVDMYCSSCGWIEGKIKDCANGVVTLIGEHGATQVNIDSILSVTHAQNI